MFRLKYLLNYSVGLGPETFNYTVMYTAGPLLKIGSTLSDLYSSLLFKSI